MTPHQMELIRDCWEHIEFLEKSIASLEASLIEHKSSLIISVLLRCTSN